MAITRKRLITLFCLVCCFSIMRSGYAQSIGQKTETWQASSILQPEAIAAKGENWFFQILPIPDDVFVRMQGKSYPADCTVPKSDLRYLRIIHHDGQGHIKRGELVCHRLVAHDLLTVFHTLYTAHYPLASVRLIDDFGADDEQSMRANNTSCFCFRRVKGSNKLSAHSRGMAIDINPLYNPYCRRRKDGSLIVQPATATVYCDRGKPFAYKIDKSDLAYRLLTAKGFVWGGTWRTLKDYQHFEKQ